jgi:hypothetical protein
MTSSVALILLGTFAAKLLALWQGSRLSMRPDPVLPFLSSETTIGIAIVIEAAVLGCLVFGRNSRTKGALLLWLAGLFSTYRVLWRMAVDSNDPCPCLGFVAQLVGLSASAGNTISIVMLVWFFVVGILLLRGSGASRFSGRASEAIRINTGLMVWIPGLASAAAAFLGNPSAEAHDLAVTGHAEVIYEESQERETIEFRLFSRKGTFFSHETGFHDTNIDAREFFFDGSMGHSIIRFMPDRLAPALVVDPKTGQPGFSTNQWKKPENDGRLRLRVDPVPEAVTTIPLWLAFGAGEFLTKAVAEGRTQKFFDVERTRRKRSKPADLVVTWDPVGAIAPGSLMTLDRTFGTTITNESFVVTSWTNVGPSRLPKRFTFRVFTSMVPPLGKLLTTINYAVESVATNDTPLDLNPDLKGSVNVLDERFATDDQPVTLVHYYITNGVVPVKSVVKGTSMYMAAYRSEYGATPPRMQLVWYGLLAAFFFLPLGWIFLRKDAAVNTKVTNE